MREKTGVRCQSSGVRYQVSGVSPRANARLGTPLLIQEGWRGERRGGYSLKLANFAQLAALLVGILLAAQSAFAQVATGIPTFSSATPSTFDTVNNANLNVMFSIPIVNKAGRGIPFNFALTYNSSIWAPVSSTWTQSGWGWSNNGQPTTGIVSYNTTVGMCSVYPNFYYWSIWNNFVYTDGGGTAHPFNITMSGWSLHSIPCGSGAPATGSGLATDGSGYNISLQGLANGLVQLNSLTNTAGDTIGAGIIYGGSGTGIVTDPNGNQITLYVDTLGMTVLTVAGSGTPSSPVTYTYYGPDGNQYAYTAKYAGYTVQTNFGCSGITEYPATSQNLVSEIDLPDIGTNSSDKYTFTYETTPGHSPNVTGRLASVTLPTGGKISYTYAGGSNGITCTDGSTATLERKTPDTGSNYWTYAHTESGTAWTTTVTDPQSNQTVYNFQGIYETERQIKQGSSVLEDVSTCYNGTSSSCNTTAITLPITQITATTTMGSLQSKVNTNYNSYGLPTEVDEYAYGSGAPGGLVRKTLTTYGVYNYPSDIQIQDSGGTTKSHTTYSYNAYGNKTGEGHYTGGTPSTISRSFTPNSYGVLTASTDFNSNSTSYSSFTCGNNTAFPQTITFPDSTSTSTVWNCYVALATSKSDVNGNATRSFL